MLSTLVLTAVVSASPFQPRVDAALNSPAGHTRFAAGELSAPLAGDLRAAVHAWALGQRDRLGLPVTSRLGAPVALGTRFGASFHLDQEVGGVEVYASRVVVTVDAHRRVIQVASSLTPYATATLDFRLTPEEAVARASRSVEWAMRDVTGRPYGAWKRLLFPRGDELRPGYLVFVPTLDLQRNWHVAVDAVTGELLFRQDRTRTADDADIYPISPGTAGVGVAPLTRVTLTHFDTPRADGGILGGDQLTMYNCCPNEGCSTASGAAPKQIQGVTDFMGFQNVPYDLAICDRVNRASNDVSVNASGDYVFTPVDPPPQGSMVSQANAADSDPFVEVHAFFHVNNVYDFLRGLSTAAQPLFPDQMPPIAAFQMNDEKMGKKPAVWTNVTVPNQFEAILAYAQTGTATSHSLSRVDNAAFMSKEQFEGTFLPGITSDVDTLMIFQGNAVDFGYDAPVLWHEFGHGVIHSTAGLAFDAVSLDSRSANNEGGAIHEGFSDFIAGAFGNRSVIGDYAGPRLAAQTGNNGPIRDMANTESCPSVLWGEVHQDSLHLSAALWDARQELGTDAALREKFDATFYAALVSLTPRADFAEAAAAVVLHVGQAFGAAAGARMQEIFDLRGVTHCSKVLDVTALTKRDYYSVSGWQGAGFTSQVTMPGPYQLKVHAPNGAQSLTVSAQVQGDLFGGGQPQLRLLARTGGPLTFTRNGNALTHDAEADVVLASSGQTVTATAQLQVPCGEDVYFTLGTTAGGGEVAQNVTWQITPPAACPAGMDAGTPGEDAGTPDAGPGPTIVVEGVEGGGTQAGGPAVGCGCAQVSPFAFAGALFALLGLSRRRRR